MEVLSVKTIKRTNFKLFENLPFFFSYSDTFKLKITIWTAEIENKPWVGSVSINARFAAFVKMLEYQARLMQRASNILVTITKITSSRAAAGPGASSRARWHARIMERALQHHSSPAASGSFNIPLPLTAPRPPLCSSPPGHRANLEGTPVSVRSTKKRIPASCQSYCQQNPWYGCTILTKLSHVWQRQLP